jgi:ABC-type sugar transport system ATPase subunit
MSDPFSLSVKDISKAFGATRALQSVSLDLTGGEIHSIVGENGSGKSTLVKILSGVQWPDSGTVTVGAQQYDRLPSPKDAAAAGICTVFQEVLVVEPRSVLENVWLGIDGLFRQNVPLSEKRSRAREILAELLDHPPDLDRAVETLSLSDRQACCIARALVRNPTTLILDEATSSLDIETRERLFVMLRRLAKSGVAVVFISHRMDEIKELGDRCTVMRSGQAVATLARKEVNEAKLVQLMTGAEHLASDSVRKAVKANKPGAVVMKAKGIELRPGRTPIDAEFRAGELIGLAGLEGHGQDAFLRALWGMEGETKGEVLRGDRTIESPKQAAAEGVAYVPRERLAESMFEAQSVRENFGLATMADDTKRGLLKRSRTRTRLQAFINDLKIKLGDMDAPISTLSGGNQQKVVISRWLATNPTVLLLNDPTRGIDLNAKHDLYELLAELAKQGTTVVMLSSDVAEHVELMDRVLVFREHELSCELTRRQATHSAIVSGFFGQTDANA